MDSKVFHSANKLCKFTWFHSLFPYMVLFCIPFYLSFFFLFFFPWFQHGFQGVSLGPRTLRTDVALPSLLALAHDRLLAADLD